MNSGADLANPAEGRTDGWYLQPDGTVVEGRGLDLPTLTLHWETGAASTMVAVETYGHRPTRSGTVRVTDAAGTIRTGALAGGGTEQATIDWSREARQVYGEDWLDSQTQSIVQGLANRWGTS